MCQTSGVIETGALQLLVYPRKMSVETVNVLAVACLLCLPKCIERMGKIIEVQNCCLTDSSLSNDCEVFFFCRRAQSSKKQV